MAHCYTSLLSTFLLGLVVAASETEFENCSTDFTTLERTLYQFADNRFQVISTFFPAREAVALYVDVTYTFLPNETHNDTITEEWIWTTGSFYLVQPPDVFRYTSLFFVNPQGRIGKLHIKFPGACRDIAGTTRTYDDGEIVEGKLELLTHRLLLYAQYNYDHVVQHLAGTGQFIGKAIPKTPEELDNIYEKNSDGDGRYLLDLYFSLTVIIPVLAVICLFLLLKSFRIPLRIKLKDKKVHPSFASLIAIGLWFSIFVVILDCFAVGWRSAWKDSGHSHPQRFIAYKMVTVTLAFDLLATLYGVICFLFSCCVAYHWKDSERLRYCCSLFPRFVVFLGHKYEPSKDSQEALMWCLCTTFVAPLFCFGSHVGYMILAWLANPRHAGGSFIVYSVSFFFYYFMFKQIYNVLVDAKVDDWKVITLCLSFLCPPYSCCRCNKRCICSFCKKCHCCKRCCQCCGDYVPINDTNHSNTASNEGVEMTARVPTLPEREYMEHEIRYKPENFSFRALFLVVISGILLTGIEAYVFVAFTKLPVVRALEDTPTYLLNLFHITVLVISVVLVYKYFSSESPVERDLLRNTIQNIRYYQHREYEELKPRQDTEVEMAAALIGALLYNRMSAAEKTEAGAEETGAEQHGEIEVRVKEKEAPKQVTISDLDFVELTEDEKEKLIRRERTSIREDA